MRTRSEPMPTLLNRQHERAALDDLLGTVRAGRGHALVIRGEILFCSRPVRVPVLNVLTPVRLVCHLPAETGRGLAVTRICGALATSSAW